MIYVSYDYVMTTCKLQSDRRPLFYCMVVRSITVTILFIPRTFTGKFSRTVERSHWCPLSMIEAITPNFLTWRGPRGNICIRKLEA